MAARTRQAWGLAVLTALSLLGVAYAATTVILVTGLQVHCGGCLSYARWLWLNFWAALFWAGLVFPAAAWLAFGLRRPRAAWILGAAPLLWIPGGVILWLYQAYVLT